MIEVKNIKKGFGEKLVLKGVDATFKPGECSLIIGRSGAGKTVLMKTIVGLERADEGEVLYNGENIYDLDEIEIGKLRRRVGMLFQNSALFDSMTVFENVLFPLQMFSKAKASERRKRAAECLRRVQLKDAKCKYPGEISGGMKKRAAIARAIALRPDFLFCDEPTSGLDPETSKVIDQLLHEITVQDNITTIVNTHDMQSVANIGDHVIFINNGKVWWEGKNDEIEQADDEILKNFVFISKL
ncbi:MAG: ATP-binding cassette domain-containing protein [Porphyromonas sp.]|nr:ATP-binding cassette domain-containing protein [Porphyromonas sp.]